MTKLSEYLKDGAGAKARAVIFLVNAINSNELEIEVARWHNCREQGYVMSCNGTHIAVFERRNSDSIAIWTLTKEIYFNPPTLDDFSNEESFDSKEFKPSEYAQAAIFIISRFSCCVRVADFKARLGK